MSWATDHNQAMRIAEAAHDAHKSGDYIRARTLFADAAKLEEQALRNLGPNQTRTLGITAISATSLWLKSREYSRTEQLAFYLMSLANLPEFALKELRTILQTVWHEQIKGEPD